MSKNGNETNLNQKYTVNSFTGFNGEKNKMNSNINFVENQSTKNINSSVISPLINKNEKQKNKPVLFIKNLTKKYGDRIAVNNISLNVFKGQIIGFLGANGAEKAQQ